MDKNKEEISTGELIGNFLLEIKSNLQVQGLELCSKDKAHVTMSFSLIKSKTKSGGFTLKLVSGEGKKTDEESQKIEIFARRKLNIGAARAG